MEPTGDSRSAARATGLAKKPVGVGSRVDWLTLAFRFTREGRDKLLSVTEDWQSDIDRQRALIASDGDESGGRHVRVRVTLPGTSVELIVKRLARPGTYLCENATLDFTVDTGSDWPIEVRLRGTAWLEGLDPGTAFEMARSVAAALGYKERRDETGKLLTVHCRRLDLCADMAGMVLTAEDRRGWVKPERGNLHIDDALFSVRRLRRGRVVTEEVLAVDRHVTTYTSSVQRVSGMYVCKGGPVELCVYDKRLHVEVCSPDTRDAEEAIWQARGWNGYDPVWRVEARFRSPALRELRDSKDAPSYRDDPEALLRNRDRLWQYVTKKWARLVVPDGAKRLARCTLDPRWEAVQQVHFGERSQPAVRQRVRGGPSAQAAIGTQLSFLAADAELEPIEELMTEDGEVCPPLDELDSVEAGRWVRIACVRLLGPRSGAHGAQRLASHFARSPTSPGRHDVRPASTSAEQRALGWLCNAWNVARARHARVAPAEGGATGPDELGGGAGKLRVWSSGNP